MASSPSFINKNLPSNEQPTAGVPAWKTCDTTVDAWDDFQNNLAPAFVSSCIGDGVYDLRAVVTDSVGNTSQDTRTNIRMWMIVIAVAIIQQRERRFEERNRGKLSARRVL